MTKKVLIGKKPARAEPARLWDVEEGAARQAKLQTKRMTFDLDAEVHLRMRLDCTKRGVHMADEIRAMIEERYPGAGRENG